MTRTPEEATYSIPLDSIPPGTGHYLAGDNMLRSKPDLLSGEYLLQLSAQDPDKYFVPNEQIRDIQLYFGQGSVEGLASGVIDTLKEYKMYTKNIGNALSFVEKAYGNDKRRTGEPAIAHVYRVIGFLAETIRDFGLRIHNSTEQGKKVKDNFILYPFWRLNQKETEHLFLAAILHDFTEIDFNSENNTYRKLGNISLKLPIDRGLKPPEEYKLIIQRFKKKDYLHDEDPEIEEELELDGFTSLFDFHRLKETLIGMNKGKSSDQAIPRQMARASINILQERPYLGSSFRIDDIYWQFLIKMIDRFDNNSTSTFVVDKDSQILPREASKIRDKVVETLQIFPKIEDQVAKILAPMLPYALYEIVKVFPGLKKNEITNFNPRFLEMLPTLWAKYVLCGYTQDQIWRGQLSASGKLVLPRLIV